jgi:hypothetical protein
VEEYGRDEAIRCYAKRLHTSSLSKPVMQRLQALRERYRAGEVLRLGCFCGELDCHGDVIARYVAGEALYQEEG